MTPGDALADRIRQFVATQVGPESVEVVTEATCRAISTLMNDPDFTSQLRIVANLQQENQWLKSQIIQLQHAMVLIPQPVVRPRKKAAPRSAAKPSRIQGSANRSAKAAFVKGVRQAKR